MKIFVISLPNALQRRRAVLEQFGDAGMSFSFFDAFPGNEIRLEDHFEGFNQATFRLNTYRDPLPNEIGCFASHRALWKYAAENREPIFILEDDCALTGDVRATFPVAGQLVGTYGFLRLESLKRALRLRLSRSPYLVSAAEGVRVYYVSNVPLCLTAYAVSPGAAARLVSASRVLSSPIDKFVQRTWEHKVPVFAISPSPVETSGHATDSTIGSRAVKQRDLRLLLQRTWYKARGELRRRAFDRNQLKSLNKISENDRPTESSARSVRREGKTPVQRH
jgi:glycosyl transferase family 25